MDSSNQFIEAAAIVNGIIPEDEEWNALRELLKEIEELPQPVYFPESNSTPRQFYISVHRKNARDETVPGLNWAAPALQTPHACAAIAIKLGPLPPNADDLLTALAEGIILDIAHTICFASHIARPGALRIHTIVLRHADGMHDRQSGIIPNLTEAIEYSRKMGWPPIRDLPLASVYAWITRNLFHLRPGDTPVSRAFNAYTWLFHSNPFHLISSVIGIEALFASSSSGVADQVRRRAELLFGSRNSFKKDLDKMYAARSAVIHGSTPIEPHGFTWDAVSNIPARTEHAEDVAIAPLLATLQRLIINGWSELTFSESLTGEDIAPRPGQDVRLPTERVWAHAEELDRFAARFTRRFD